MANFTTYLIVNKRTGLPIYAGSTQHFNVRRSNHKSRCNNSNDPGHHYPLYQYIRSHGGFDNFQMVVYKQHRSRTACMKSEVKLIKEIRPVGNVVHKN